MMFCSFEHGIGKEPFPRPRHLERDLAMDLFGADRNLFVGSLERSSDQGSECCAKRLRVCKNLSFHIDLNLHAIPVVFGEPCIERFPDDGRGGYDLSISREGSGTEVIDGLRSKLQARPGGFS